MPLFKPRPYGIKRSPNVAGGGYPKVQTPQTPKDGRLAGILKIVIILVSFIFVAALDVWFANSTGSWIIQAVLLTFVGLLFLFSSYWPNKIIIGLVPLVLAVARIPVVRDFPVIGFFGLGWGSLIFSAILLYYFLWGMRKERHKAMVESAGRAGAVAGKAAGKAGVKVVKKGSVLLKFLIFAIVTAAVYLLEIYLDFVGGLVTGVVLIIVALLLIFRKGIMSKVLGLVCLILVLPNVALFVPGMESFLNLIYIGNYIGIEAWPRYVLVLIIAFYWQFRKKEWATKDVSEL